jgi:hypothetical protein
MRRIIVALAGTAFLGLLLGVGAGCRKAEEPAAKQGKVTAGQVRAKAREAVKAARDYTAQEREEYQRQMEVRLAELDRRINALKAEAGKAGKTIQSDVQKKIRKLKKQQKLVRRKMDELKTSGGEAWGELKVLLDRTTKRIEKSLSRLSPATAPPSPPPG